MSDPYPQRATNTLPEAPGNELTKHAAGLHDDLFRLLVENTRDYAIFLLDPDGRIVSWNEGAKQIKGYSAGDVMGRHFSMLYLPDDVRAGKPEQELRKAAEEGRCEDEGWRVRKDGSCFWAHVVITALRSPSGELRGFAKVTRDATERLRTEQALKEGSDRFWTLFHSVRVGVVLAGPNAEVVMFNAAACELVGLTANQLAGKTSFDSEWKAIYEDGSPCPGPEHPIPRAIATRQAVRNAVVGVHRPRIGDLAWLLVNAEPRLAADGSVKEVICTFTDITERKRAEAAIAEWKNRYEAAIRASGQILYDCVSATNDVTYGGDTERLLGYSAKQLAGGFNRWVELIHEDDREAFIKENLRIQGTGEAFHQEYRIRNKNGNLMLVRDVGQIYYDHAGNVLGMVGYVSDITEQRRAEEKLRASEERFRQIFSHAAAGMCLVDLEGRLLEVNPALCAITGYTEEELLGRTVLSITHPDDVAWNHRAVQQMMRGESPSLMIEKRYLHKDGRVVWVRVSASLLRDAQGRPDRAVALLEDITERKKAEEALRELSGKLLRMQDEERRRLARELHDSTAQSMAALTMNLAIVNEEASALGGDARRALDDSVVLAEQCVRELRTFSYLLHPPVLDDLGLAPALSWYVDGFVQRSGIHVTVDIPRNLGRLPQAVELVLFRIVQESLTNIHRHSGSRKAGIRIACGDTEISLEVMDEGHGISELKQSPADGPGVGVGIASMRERVREVGGRFEMESEAGGTRVRVVIPRSPGPA